MTQRRPVPRGPAATPLLGGDNRDKGTMAESRPLWQTDLLQSAVWTHHQFLSALCGTDPDGAAKSPDEWDAERRRAERLVDGAIAAGELTVEYWHAATEDEPYGDYYIGRDEAIRWATKFPGRFPQFLFTVDDLPPHRTLEGLDPRTLSEVSAPASQQPALVEAAPTPRAVVGEQLKDHRNTLISGPDHHTESTSAHSSGPPKQEALSIREAATVLGVHEDTIRRMGQRGEIEIISIGPKLKRVPKSEIARLRATSKFSRR